MIKILKSTVWVVVVAVVASIGLGAANATTAPSPNSVFGLNWVGSAEMQPRAERFQVGAATGVGWDRWVFYWSSIERSPGQFDWSAQDRTFLAEASSGLSINGVLLTTPDFHARSGKLNQPLPSVTDKRPFFELLEAKAKGQALNAACPGAANTYPPRSLNEPIFINQGGQTVVNPANHWALFVFRAVERYKPGGELARAHGLNPNFGVRAWEIWNEPDWDCNHSSPGGFGGFFNGSPTEYYQMLKIAYQVVKFSDPSAYVVTGGLTYWANPGWFDELAAAFRADPDKPSQTRNNLYFDAVALHWYSNVHHALDQSSAFSRRIRDQGLGLKPIWLTETGLPLIGDGVGPEDPNSPYRGSIDDQASYIIQNAAYALWMRRAAPSGTDRIFHFQLYDDGIEGALGVFGLIRNPVGYAPHPSQPGVPRPGYSAMQVATRYLDGASPLTRDGSNGVERIAFQRPNGERVTVLWNWNATERTVSVRATAGSARLVDRVGGETNVAPSGGNYSVRLPGATNFNQPETPGVAMIGGAPYLLVESGTPLPPSATPTATATVSHPSPTPSPTGSPAPTSTPITVGCVNLLNNGGFEQTGVWTYSQASRSTFQRYLGQYSAFVGLSAVPGSPTWSTLRQNITLPASPGSFTLSYAQSLGAGTRGGKQVVEVWADDLIIKSVQELEPGQSQPWSTKSFDETALLRPYLGRPISLVFAVRNDPNADSPTLMRLDEVALTYCAAPEPTATPTVTSTPTLTPTPTATPINGTIYGRVADATGWGIAGASVNLNGEGVARSITTEASGQFVFPDLPRQPYVVSASANGFGVWLPRNNIRADATLEFRLPPSVNAMNNGGFETDPLAPWSLSGSTPGLLQTTGLSGRGLVLGDQFRPDPGRADGNSTLAQTITVPDAPLVGLGYAYRLETTEATSGADFFEVLVIDEGQRTDLVAKLWHPSQDWVYRWLDLSRWRGQSILLIFNLYQSSADRPTRVWLDEVSVGPGREVTPVAQVFLPYLAASHDAGLGVVNQP